MELVFLVWLISILGVISHTFGIAASLIMGASGIYVLFANMMYYDGSGHAPRNKTGVAVFFFGFLLAVIANLVPTEKTAYLMVGAYATQKIAEAPKTQQIGAEVLKIIELKVKHYAQEAEEEALKAIEKKAEKK